MFQVLRARRSFVMAELGARWGTWGARAAAALATLNPMPGVPFWMSLCVEILQVFNEGDSE